MLCFPVDLIYLKLFDGPEATTKHFLALSPLVGRPNVAWYPTMCDDGS